MFKQESFLEFNGIDKRVAIERLTALWALNECALGGIMHAFKLPFTGILVGGGSILLITLIASFANKIGGSLLKAIIIVLMVKIGVSPYTPIAAYFAVFFQAALGFLMFRLFSINSFSIITLCAITFLESALQKLLTLTIVFGHSFWDAADVYMEGISKQLAFLHATLSSNTLIYTYLGIYFVCGILAGMVIIRTIQLIENVNLSNIDLDINSKELVIPSNRKQRFKKRKIYFYMILLAVVIIPIVFIYKSADAWQNAIIVVLRSALVLIIWYAILGPILMKYINRILLKKGKSYNTDLTKILSLLPSLKAVIYHSWKHCEHRKGLNKLPHFLATSIAYSLCLHLKDN